MEQNETRTLWISIGAALFSVILLWGWAQGKKAEFDKKFRTKTTVVIAKVDITEMAIIDESMLEIIETPADFVQPSALKDPETAIGQVAAAPIKKGEQILDTKLLLPGQGGGLAMQVTPEKRAVTIPIDATRGNAKLLKPGDRIDILAALDIGSGNNKKREIRTVLQDVPILATGENVVNELPLKIEREGKDYKTTNLKLFKDFNTITIEVKPIDAQSIVFILSTNPASLYTVLRNPSDRLLYPLKTTDVEEVMKKVRAPTTADVPAKPIIPVPEKKPEPPPQKAKHGIYEEI